MSAGAELESVSLEDALAILLLVRDEEPELFERAAVRWAGQVMTAAPTLGFEGSGELLDELAELVGVKRGVARSRLSLLLRGVGMPRVAAVLERA